jgi:WD40 repeat protein
MKVETLKGHRDTIQALKFSRNSNQLLSGSCDRTFKMWDAGERAFIDT